MSKELAVISNKLSTAVMERIGQMTKSSEINLPANYSAPNALKSAALILQQTQDRNKQPVLKVCDSSSIQNCLFDMVVQGLNPAKKQCYFIAYEVLSRFKSYCQKTWL